MFLKKIKLSCVFVVLILLLNACEKANFGYEDEEPTEQTNKDDNGKDDGNDEGKSDDNDDDDYSDTTTEETDFVDGNTTTDKNGFKTGDTVDVKTFLTKDISCWVWVKGYIVGACTKNIKYAQFDPPFTYDTAILLADKKGENDPTKVVSIQLKKSSSKNSLRRIYNLKDNPQNYNKQAAFFGQQATYLGVVGMKDNIGADKLFN